MSSNLTQPEEIDLVLSELETSDMKIGSKETVMKAPDQKPREWNGSHASAYRAAYLKAHGPEHQ